MISPLALLWALPMAGLHLYEGCPENSLCTPKLGAKYLQWGQANPREIPLGVYAQGESAKKFQEDLILWDSPCPSHRKGPTKTFLALGFFSQSMAQPPPGAIVPKLLMDGKAWPIPRGELPLFVQEGRLHFNLFDQGKYYGLAISQKGQLTLTDVGKTSFLPKAIPCPAKLIQGFSQLSVPRGIYMGATCGQIWNKDTKTFHSFVRGQVCP